MKTDNLWKQYLNDQPLRKALILADLDSSDIGNQIFLLCCDDYFKIQKESRFLIIAYLFLIPDISPLQLNVENLSKKVTTENGIMQKFNYELKDKTYEKAPVFSVDDALKNLYATVLLDLTNGTGQRVMTSTLSFGTLLETYRDQKLSETQWANILLGFKTKGKTSDDLVVKNLFSDWSYDTKKYKGTFTGSQILEKSINSLLPDMWDEWFRWCTETQNINPELFSLLFSKLFPSLSFLYSDLAELGRKKENQFKSSSFILPTRDQILALLNDPNIVKKLPVDVIKKFEEKRKKTEVTLSMLIEGLYPEK